MCVLLIVAMATWSLPLFGQLTQGGQINFKTRELKAPDSIKTKLQQLRLEIAHNNWSFTIGFTKPSEMDLAKLAGGKPPVNLMELSKAQVAHAAEMLKIDNEARDLFLKANPNLQLWEVLLKCAATSGSFDYRKSGKVSPVKDQDGCGSCWDFAAISAYEASYAIRNNAIINASEQCVLDCCGCGGCGGSWYTGVFDWLISHGTASEAAYPYVAHSQSCKTAVATSCRAVARGVVHPEVDIPSVAQIKEALCTYGPLAVGILATSFMQNYTGGVYDGGYPPLIVTGSDGNRYYNVNHCVTIIGWNDTKSAWIIKNSWGTNWGETCGYGTERGYIYVKYGTGNVGLNPQWVRAKSNYYAVNIDKLKLIYPEFRPIPPENPLLLKKLPQLNKM